LRLVLAHALISLCIVWPLTAMEETAEDDLDLQLFEAAYTGDNPKAIQLLKRGADGNTSFEGLTTLYWAVFTNNYELIKLILNQATIEVNAKDKDGWTPLQ